MKSAIFDIASMVDVKVLQDSTYNYFQKELEQKLQGTTYERYLKKQLKEELIDQLLGTQIPNLNSIQKGWIDIIKKFSSSKILLWTQKRTGGIELAEEVLKMAMNYHLSSIVVLMTEELQYHYSVINYDSRKFNRYNELLDKWLKAYEAEILAQKYYCQTVAKVKGNRTPDHIIKEANPLIKKLEPFLSETHTYKFHFSFYLLKTLRYQVENNHNEVKKYCNEALDYFNKIEVPLPYTTKFVFLSRQITPLIHMGEYDAAKDVIFECLKLPAKGSYNWNATLQHLVFLGFHSDRPDLAYSAYLKVKQNRSKFESPKLNEQWRIYKAYLVLYKRHGLLDIPENLRLYKFLNEVPIQSKDKYGFNIAILILQCLLLLTNHHYDKFADRAENLRSYVQYHLRKDESYRVQLFIRMLLKIESGKFRKATVGRMTEGQLKKLKEFPLAQSNANLESEIVPFEKLWEIAMSCLR